MVAEELGAKYAIATTTDKDETLRGIQKRREMAAERHLRPLMKLTARPEKTICFSICLLLTERGLRNVLTAALTSICPSVCLKIIMTFPDYGRFWKRR